MGSPCISKNGFSVTCHECGSDLVKFEYDYSGCIMMVCENCNNGNLCSKDMQDDDEVTVVFENLESFVIRKKHIDLLFDDNEMIYEIRFKEENICCYDDWCENIGAYDRIIKHPDICSVYINHGADNQIRFYTNWIDNGDDNLLQKSFIDDDNLITITFNEDD